MGVRLKKYYVQCKDVSCTGRRTKGCPETPKRKNGQNKACSAWSCEFRNSDGKWVSLVYPDVRNRLDAEKRLSVLIADRERGILRLPTRKAIPTVGSYCEGYLKHISGTAKENTLLNKRRAIRGVTLHLGDYRIDKLTPFLIERFRLDRMEKDGVQASTANEDCSVLKHILNTAIREKIITENPCSGIKRLMVEATKDRILSQSEISLILDMPFGKDRLMILFGLFTGMRLNEVLRLKWQDIDLARGLIVFIQSKTNKGITVPLSSYLENELQEYQADCCGDGLFEDREITKVVVTLYSNHFSRLFKKLGIDDFTFHGLRHSFASLSSDTGADIVTTKELLGHSDITTTMRYSHKQIDVKRNAIDRMTNHILGMSKEKGLTVAIQA